jgi:putative PIN family toxin of toxin-antitoxin system
MRAACDTNIWLRGLFRSTSYPGRVIDAWLDGRFLLVTSDQLLAEAADVLTRAEIQSRFRITPERVGLFLTQMRALGEVITITGAVQGCRDPDDDMLVETAILGKADALVTQDNDLLTMTVPGLTIVTAYDFVQMLDALP